MDLVIYIGFVIASFMISLCSGLYVLKRNLKVATAWVYSFSQCVVIMCAGLLWWSNMDSTVISQHVGVVGYLGAMMGIAFINYMALTYSKVRKADNF
ncbi:hypothetical protein ACFYKX_05120 [Cytobacillus sp. FJAT-54145]|uniref:YesK-like protein n=1 Tax=Cytobacillus spartinae TaxID=3299023 RepID=A0ABW6K736_9BACI